MAPTTIRNPVVTEEGADTALPQEPGAAVDPPAGEARRGAAAPRRGGVIGVLLRFPLFYKILIANAVMVGVVLAAAILVMHPNLNADGGKLLALLGGGMLASIATNAVILRFALSPLKRLERTAQRVRAGDLRARVEPSDLADRQLARLMSTFNTMLESGDVYRQRLRDTAARALAAQEEERKRIAQELHDGTAQTLTALRVRLRVARALAESEARTQLLERISSELGEATEEIRRIAQGLRPPALDMLGLAAAIESCSRDVADTAGVTLETALQGVEGLLTPEAELVLYRIVQEALSNVARHAHARTVRVRLAYAGSTVTVVVEDDGRGFNVAAEMSNGGLGLFGMQERAGYVGGTVAIESEPGAGTRVRATIPIGETARYA
jgi:two-component system, NarL family, sensor histidine kinase UhpB